MKFNRELLKGFLKTIILATLQDGECHAYALSKRIEEKSLGVFDLSENTIYPTLHKLEKDGLISSEWKEREKGPKIRIYQTTPKGQKVVTEFKRDWKFFSRAIRLILEPETPEDENYCS